MNKLIKIVSVLVVVGMILTACASTATQTTAPAATTVAASTEVEVFSWWVGPGEADGLAAMVKIFEAQYPTIKFINAAVTGGAGTNAKAVLATRLAAGDPRILGRLTPVRKPSPTMWQPNRFSRWMTCSPQLD